MFQRRKYQDDQVARVPTTDWKTISAQDIVSIAIRHKKHLVTKEIRYFLWQYLVAPLFKYIFTVEHRNWIIFPSRFKTILSVVEKWTRIFPTQRSLGLVSTALLNVQDSKLLSLLKSRCNHCQSFLTITALLIVINTLWQKAGKDQNENSTRGSWKKPGWIKISRAFN